MALALAGDARRQLLREWLLAARSAMTPNEFQMFHTHIGCALHRSRAGQEPLLTFAELNNLVQIVTTSAAIQRMMSRDAFLETFANALPITIRPEWLAACSSRSPTQCDLATLPCAVQRLIGDVLPADSHITILSASSSFRTIWLQSIDWRKQVLFQHPGLARFDVASAPFFFDFFVIINNLECLKKRANAARKKLFEELRAAKDSARQSRSANRWRELIMWVADHQIDEIHIDGTNVWRKDRVVCMRHDFTREGILQMVEDERRRSNTEARHYYILDGCHITKGMKTVFQPMLSKAKLPCAVYRTAFRNMPASFAERLGSSERDIELALGVPSAQLL